MCEKERVGVLSRAELSEDSFINFFCEIERCSDHSKYFWPDGGDWGKFNFIRVYDNKVSKERIEEIINLYKDEFFSHGKTISLKANFDLSKFDFLKEAGVPIVSIKVPNLFQKYKVIGSSLYVVKNEIDLFEWWNINSDGRDRQGKSPIFPIIENIYKDANSRFYILKSEGEGVACGAITKFDDSFNLWGLATRKDHQRKGFMKSITTFICKDITRDFFTVQVNLDSASFKFFSQVGGSEFLNIEKRFAVGD